MADAERDFRAVVFFRSAASGLDDDDTMALALTERPLSRAPGVSFSFTAFTTIGAAGFDAFGWVTGLDGRLALSATERGIPEGCGGSGLPMLTACLGAVTRLPITLLLIVGFRTSRVVADGAAVAIAFAREIARMGSAVEVVEFVR